MDAIHGFFNACASPLNGTRGPSVFDERERSYIRAAMMRPSILDIDKKIFNSHVARCFATTTLALVAVATSCASDSGLLFISLRGHAL